jgi:dihydrofolate reductase
MPSAHSGCRGGLDAPTTMKISLIVAAATNNVIGRDGELPWHLSEDLKRFKKLTVGKPIIMGRLTHESIGKPLPDRRNIVISSQKDLEIEGCEVVSSPDEALALAEGAEEVMVIGGGKIYQQLMPKADRIYMTFIDDAVDGDTFFPDVRSEEWQVYSQEDFPANDSRAFGYSFVTLDRVRH